jgi:hypothetical protein
MILQLHTGLDDMVRVVWEWLVGFRQQVRQPQAGGS